ncbi:S1 family peptidase [Runella sp.]|uniref:S1 family peptidase n=1 Tax=Runella sp. TaxID=1960881 RepID=UPI003D1021DE
MNGRIFLLCLLVYVPLFQSCRKEQDPKKLKNSVVLIRTQFVFKVAFSKDLVFYFNELDDAQGIKGGLDGLLGKDDAYARPNEMYGTGFFIGKDGKIATNRHVVEGLTKTAVSNIINKLKIQMALIEAQIAGKEQQVSAQISRLEYEQQAYDYDNSADIATLQGQLLKVQQTKSIVDVLRSATTDSHDIQVTTEILDLGIAMNNTYINKASDFIGCVLLKIAEKDGVDLAIIQTKDKKLPAGIKTFFKVPKIVKLKVREGDEVMIIGYNRGLSIGNTSEGLKVQQLEGKISQVTDDVKMQYDISTLPGSSGSPVFNKAGRLIAVNFAGIDGSQLKYGIHIKHLADLLKDLSSDSDDSEEDE